MPKLLFQGHGSYRLTSGGGRIIYVDPYKGKGYGAPADLILVTHQHRDHNQIKRCAQKPDCRIITNEEALAALELDYALFPGDGMFNMGPDEAAECAKLVGAKHNMLIHLKPGESYRKKAEKWGAPDKLIIEPGEEINL